MANESKATALRAKTAEELKQELVVLRKEEFELRMQKSAGQLSDTSRFKKIRREVARINTVMNEQAKQA